MANKTQTVTENIIYDITRGALGKIGQPFLSVRQAAARYNISYKTAYKVFEALRRRGILVLGGRRHILCDCFEGAPQNDKELTVGVHVRDISNQFYSALCAQLEKYAKKAGLNLLFMSSDDNHARKREILNKFVKLGCRGVINLNSFNDSLLVNYYRLYPLPMVMFGVKKIEGLKTDFIETDNYSSGIAAARHLIETGARTFYYADRQGQRSNDERHAGFGNALERQGYAVDGIIRLDSDENDMGELSYIANMLYRASRKGKIGIFCHHDLLALAIIKLCLKAGIAIPGEAGIIGYDDLPISRYTEPKISTFSYNYAQIAIESISALTKRIKEPQKNASEIIIPTALLIRQSTKNL